MCAWKLARFLIYVYPHTLVENRSRYLIPDHGLVAIKLFYLLYIFAAYADAVVQTPGGMP